MVPPRPPRRHGLARLPPSTLALLAGAAAVAAGSLAVAGLGIVRVVPAWTVLFVFVLPTLFFVAWGLAEVAPTAWRSAALPLRRTWRTSRFSRGRRPAETPLPHPPPAPRARPGAFATAVRAWFRLMRPVLGGMRAPLVRRTFNVVFAAAALAVLAFVVREFVDQGWPFSNARPAPIAAASACFLSTFALRAIAWQHLFRPVERPGSLALVGANGTAAVASLVFPPRIDDAIAIAALRRLARRPTGIGTLVLSLFLLGVMDVAALTPFALFSAVSVPASGAVRLSLWLVAAMGVGAALLAAALPSIRSSRKIVSFRLGHWLARHAPGSRADTIASWWLVAASWLTRAGGLYLLLDGLGVGRSFPLATAYVCATAAAATLPIAPASAATQAGVGAAVLAGGGVEGHQAVALAVAAQALSVAAGAAFAVFAFAALLVRRRVRLERALSP